MIMRLDVFGQSYLRTYKDAAVVDVLFLSGTKQ